jgi:hypothetical protein
LNEEENNIENAESGDSSESCDGLGLSLEFPVDPDCDREPGTEIQGIEPVTEVKEPGSKRPVWAVIIITIWVVAFYAAFYFFLIAHRFEKFAMGG